MADETPNAETPPESPTGNLPEFSVSEIAGLLKRTVEERFPYVRVRGEISGLKFHSSGHVYFDLKDDKAVLNAVVWRPTAQRLKLKPEAGLEVICSGRVSTYPMSSRYQLIVERIELAGLGALMAMLEERKKRLSAEGLFDVERKKPLPYLPAVVGVITSPTGAVICDILHRLADRCPRHVVLWPVAVQGERAAGEIAAAIRGFNALKAGGAIARPDVIIVARGGGSFEDLLAFSEETVVRAAAESAIPLISAVGHETDTTLIDFASDRRAPTPTAAAEMAVPVLSDLVETLLTAQTRMLGAASRAMESRAATLQALARVLPRPDALFAQPRQRFDHAAERLQGALVRSIQRHRAEFVQYATLLRPRLLSEEIKRGSRAAAELSARMARAYETRVRHARDSLEGSVRVLESVSHRSVLARGFALVRGADGTLRRRAGAIAPGEALTLTFADGDKRVVETGKPGPARVPAKPKAGQGDLF